MTDWDNVTTWVGAHVVAVAVVTAPVLFAEATGSASTLDDWIPVYVAGAFGGLVLELITGRGQIEIAGPARAASPEEEAADPRRALLPQFDLGVFARLFLGGMAAVVALMLVAAAGDKALAAAAASDASIGWGIATGAASAAVWTTLQQLAAARIDAVVGENEATRAATRDALEVLRQMITEEQAKIVSLGNTGQAGAMERLSGGLAVAEAQLDAAAAGQ